ncbi:MAG: prepilin-type N-terminal cleavage/methylation domain-containing protein [Candidatus Pacebacteria bacterium]|jgi:Tfp pilus assembly protein FimT|nr:prepilin-type N-terminal cleavage/methylation domain-containing protein [Candidatus Paceibacterota bacterium]
MRNKQGFTLIDIVIVSAIIALLVATAVSPFSQFRNAKTLEVATEQALSLLSRARSDTLAAKQGIQYGVHFETTKMVLYRNATYTAGDPTNEETLLDGTIEISSISLGGGSEVLFQRLTGKTSNAGTIVLRVKSDPSASSTITIVGTGIVGAN